MLAHRKERATRAHALTDWRLQIAEPKALIAFMGTGVEREISNVRAAIEQQYDDKLLKIVLTETDGVEQGYSKLLAATTERAFAGRELPIRAP